MSVIKEWPLSFISKEDFYNHVKKTISKYDSKLESINLSKFNTNIIDPIKLIFDKAIYAQTWDATIKYEISRQRDKSNNNEIGYFHQLIFSYIQGCEVPEHGWDVIFRSKDGITLPTGEVVHTIYVEMKNKHNTMNSSSAGKTVIRMQNQILKESNCACFLVEAIAKKSQNIVWSTTVDGDKVSNNLIRRVSLDKFYEIVTGEECAFFQMCSILPDVIDNVVSEEISSIRAPKDSVMSELIEKSKSINCTNQDLAITLALYLLGFETYSGFSTINC